MEYVDVVTTAADAVGPCAGRGGGGGGGGGALAILRGAPVALGGIVISSTEVVHGPSCVSAP